MTRTIALKSDDLLKKISFLLEQARSRIVREVDQTMVYTYWHIGREIVEFEQGGKKKAEYGSGLLEELSKTLIKRFGEGFSVRNLRRIKNFYLLFGKRTTLSSDFRNLSWSHYVFLMQIEEKDKRKFYAIESNVNNWSLRELKRQFDSSLYHRLALSKNKKGVKKLSQRGQIIEKPEDVLKEPYVLEFLGLDEKCSYSERELESAIISHLQKFLLEMGKGLMFVERQKRITNHEEHYYVDLVFYHRFLNCFVLIDLKRGKLTHQDIGQMQMYVNYFDRKIRKSDENKTIGLLLCEQNNRFVVEYTLPEVNNQIYSREYKLYLPSKRELQLQLEKKFKKC